MAIFITEQFIDELQRYEFFYNRYYKDCKKKFKKLNAWKTQGKKSDFTQSMAEGKFKNVRTAWER